MGQLTVVIPSNSISNLRVSVEAVSRLDPASIIVVEDYLSLQSCGELMSDYGVNIVPGFHPFNFARNVNVGIVEAGTDVIVMNDDAVLKTPTGLSTMAALARRDKSIGLCSAAIDGDVCNDAQRPHTTGGLRNVNGPIAFVCVYIPRRIIKAVGLLDQRFDGYGFEDFDYCRRVREAGYDIAVFDGCVMGHQELPSSYRTRPDIRELMEHSRRIYQDKWNAAEVTK